MDPAPDPGMRIVAIKKSGSSAQIRQHIFDAQAKIVGALNSVSPRSSPIARVFINLYAEQNSRLYGPVFPPPRPLIEELRHQRAVQYPLSLMLPCSSIPGVRIVTLTGSSSMASSSASAKLHAKLPGVTGQHSGLINFFPAARYQRTSYRTLHVAAVPLYENGVPAHERLINLFPRLAQHAAAVSIEATMG